MADGIEHGEEFPGAFPVAQPGQGHGGPDRGVGVLAAVFPHPRHVALDVPGVEVRGVERRGEQFDKPRLADHKAFLHRRQGLPGPSGIAAAGQDRPALADGVDLAFLVFRRAERRAVVEVGPAVPLAVPAVGFDAASQQGSLSGTGLRQGHVTPTVRQPGEQLQVFVEEKGQPDAFALAALADAVHAVVPVAAAHKRQAVRAETQAVSDGPRAVVIEAGRFRGSLRLVVIRLLVRIEEAPSRKETGSSSTPVSPVVSTYRQVA